MQHEKRQFVNFDELIFAVKQQFVNFAELNFAESAKKCENKFCENLFCENLYS